MTYGSATTSEHVFEYLNRIYRGKASNELIQDFKSRYDLVGGSPLIDITKKQASLLQEKLGSRFVVRAGMRHSEPFVEHAVSECKVGGATKLVGIILSPQFSPFIMNGYRTELTEAAEKHGYQADRMQIADAWPTEEHFIEFLAGQTQSKLSKLESECNESVPVVFTTHSLPRRVVKKDSDYLKQIESTVNAVVKKINDSELEWYAGYQSAGHSAEEWLTPDLTDILADLSKRGKKTVLIVPIQFLADHLEILYDLDIAAKEQCEEYDIGYNRIALPNTNFLFINALAAIVRKSCENSAEK